MTTHMSSVKNKRAKKAGAMANELIADLNRDTAPAAQDEDQAQKTETDLIKAEASTEDQQNLDQSQTPQPGAEPAKAADDWEARFKGMQIAYNREVPKLRSELEAANQVIDTLKSDIDSLKEAVNKPVEEQREQAEELQLSDEEIEQYGPGWVEMMKRIAQGSSGDLAKQVVNLQQQLAELKSGQEKIVEHTAATDEEKYFVALKESVPNWETINNDPKFHEFLAEVVPYTDKERQYFLLNARNELNAGKTIQIFNDFIGVVSKGSPQTTETTPDLDVPEEMVNPKNSGGGMIPKPEETYYTTEQINNFYQDKLNGKYKGREEEAKRIEKDIFAAGQDGRIASNKRADNAYKFGKDEF